MKKFMLILLVTGILFSIAGNAQNVNLTKLPKEERKRISIELSVAAMKMYAPSYYREDLKPIFYEGTVTNQEDKNYGRPLIQIDFPFDLVKDRKDGDDNIYGGIVSIYGDTGKVFTITPTGWMIRFTIDDEIETRNGTHKIAEPTKVPKNPFKLRTIVVDSNNQIIEVCENN